MHETLEQLLRLVQGAWRFRKWAMIIAWPVCLVGWFVVALQPDVYKAQARVHVNTASELREVLDNQIVETDDGDRLRRVREAMLGTDRLEQLIREVGLLGADATRDQIRGLASSLREQILIESANETERRRRRLGQRTYDDTYTIGYEAATRQGAIAVVEKLLEIFQRDLTTRSGGGEQFLLKQKKDYEDRLRAAEQALADFNQRHIDRLPSLQGGYVQQLQDETTALETARTELTLAKKRLESLDQQLRGEASVLVSGEVDEGSLEGRIRSTQTRLDELRLRFTDVHPDVTAAEESLAALKREHEQQMKRLRAGDLVAVSNNPVYQAIRISQHETKTEIAKLEASVAEREARLARLRGLINEMPGVEAELAQLTRDTAVIKDQHQALLNSIERERLSREVSETAPVEFQVLDPPTSGRNPVAPNRPIQIFLVFAFAVGAAFGLVFVLAQFFPVFSTSSELESRLELPVIGAVTNTASVVERRHRLWSHAFFGVVSSALVVAFVGVLYVEVAGGGLRSMVLG